LRKVEVCSYKEKWALEFEQEKEILKIIFKDEIIDIHHIGSTSVPGLKAKPTIDIMPVVKDIHNIDHYNEAMRDIGYEPKGENGIPGRRYFQKGGDQRSHHVHIYKAGSEEITRHLAFRDYLLTHPEDKERYGDLKEKLAQQFPYDVKSYIKGKDRLVRELEVKALEWEKNQE
jgi:GrpB-like predicted nucleotidyltransferase (UPF0157 family)